MAMMTKTSHTELAKPGKRFMSQELIGGIYKREIILSGLRKMDKQLAIKERCQPNVDIPLAEGSMETILFIFP